MPQCHSPLCLGEQVEENVFCETHQFILDDDQGHDSAQDAVDSIFSIKGD